MQALRSVFRFWAVLVFVAVLAQVGAAGYGAFYTANKLDDKGDVLTHNGFENGWDFHAGFGYIVVLGGLILLVLALLASPGRGLVILSAILAALFVIQVLLAYLGTAVPGAGFLHPLNALLLFAGTGLLAHRLWAGARRPA